MTLREPTDEEVIEIASHPMVERAVIALARARKQRPP